MIVEAFERMPRLLACTALGHAVLAVACAVALVALPAEPIASLHPAVKPLKFAISIAVFLATMGVLLPSLSVEEGTRDVLAALFALTMVSETVPIVVQALRGTTSHFNSRDASSKIAWSVMGLAIVVASVGMIVVTFAATARPLLDPPGTPMAPLLALGWRAGLWLLLLAPVTGFAMGSRLRHSVGGEDGGPGLTFVDWSTTHGDLRVSHFVALHALQVLPAAAWLLLRIELGERARTAMLGVLVALASLACVATLAQALLGRPLVR